MARTLQDIYIENIENAIRGIRLNTKTPKDVGATVSDQVEKLKKVNEGMANDMLIKYSQAVKGYNDRQPKK